jgi:hypothetical protein
MRSARCIRSHVCSKSTSLVGGEYNAIYRGMLTVDKLTAAGRHHALGISL